MPEKLPTHSVRIRREAYEALMCMKHGDMTISDVIEDLIDYFVKNEVGDIDASTKRS